MNEAEAPFEMDIVTRVLGVSVQQLIDLCSVTGIAPCWEDGEATFTREALERLNALLYPTYVGVA